ncbi:hypothetical protein DKM19_28260 [Streptosporangium sp. 'caverna']|nr:hypothetical protein DKM19_28260 [Streptosporangium sp. 'caverna']
MDLGKVLRAQRAGVGETDEELSEVEADRVRMLPGDVDRDEGVRSVGGDQEVLRAGVAVPDGLGSASSRSRMSGTRTASVSRSARSRGSAAPATSGCAHSSSSLSWRKAMLVKGPAGRSGITTTCSRCRLGNA